MSLFDTFDPASEEIIKVKLQRSFQEAEDFPEVVIAAFKEETFRLLPQVCPAEQTAVLRAGRAIPVYRVHWQGRDLGIFHTLLGGAGTACLMEQLLARGAKKILLYGNCGVLDRAITAGHLILPTAAYRDEGVSYHYLPLSDYVDIPTHKCLAEIFDALHLPYVTGRVWTTDAFYRETRSNLEKRKAEGCIAVDMECASAMAVGQFRGASVYQFFYADDCLDGETWDPRTMGAMPATGHEKYLRVALEVAARL
ncbi:MAG: nucleoside phosphorylase [Oscillospiraceae bacterium]